MEGAKTLSSQLQITHDQLFTPKFVIDFINVESVVATYHAHLSGQTGTDTQNQGEFFKTSI